MRSTVLGLREGTTVWIKRSRYVFSSGTNWWIMGRSSIYLFSEVFGGVNMRLSVERQRDNHNKLISTAENDAQRDLLNMQAKRLIAKENLRRYRFQK